MKSLSHLKWEGCKYQINSALAYFLQYQNIHNEKTFLASTKNQIAWQRNVNF